jgi:hypothetical protein
VSPDSPAARFLSWEGWPTVAVVTVVVAGLLTVALAVRLVRRLRARLRRGPVEVVVHQMHCSDGWWPDLPWEVQVRRVENGRIVGYRHVPGLHKRRRLARREAYRIANRERIRCPP